jgi:diguanylate cyclase (GGDEF)-like protein
MSARPFTILIFSPDRSTLRRLSRFVEVFGYDVRQAADAAQALAAADAAHPDFLLLDASSGEPTDLALCRQIRKLSSHVYTYSLMLTADAEVARLTEALEAGFDDFLAQPVVFGELLARLRTGARVIEFERRLAEQTGLDAVTGLPAKAALVTSLHARLENAKADGGWLAIIDLDYFSRIHTRHGRPVSESVLRSVADLVKGRCTGEQLLTALGDDRLALLTKTGPAEAAVGWADQTLAMLAGREFTAGGQSLKITASCGLTFLHPGDTIETVLARAEKATQLAKGSGRGCVATSQEVDRETDQWAAMAANGELFATTLARDVMTPCALLVQMDESIDQVHALLELTRLSALPVIDNEGKLAGVVTVQQVEAARSKAKPRGGSVKLLRHILTADVAKFDELTPLSELMEFFTGDSATLAVIVRDRRPKGIVHAQGLAALNEQLTADHFATTAPRSNTSEDLLVPDLAVAE